jgi:hypothetical protein
MPADEIRAAIKELEQDITLASKLGAPDIVAWKITEKRSAEAALARRNGTTAPSNKGDYWPEVLSAAELLALPPDPTRWVWNECLPLRATSALIAKAYTGKSTFAASLALAVSRGIEFLGRGTQTGAVLYVYLDGPIDELKENLINIGLNSTDQVFTYAGRKPYKVLPWVKEQCQKHAVKLLIVDTAQKFFGFREDKYEEKINTMQPMLDLVDEFNFHAMFTYHAAKNSANTVSALGSVAVEANARVSLYLRRHEDSNDRIFDTMQNTGKRFQAIGLSDPKDGFLTSTGTLSEIEIRACYPLIRELIEEEPGIMEKAILATIEKRRRILVLALRQMLEIGSVERVRSLAGGARDPWHYYITGTAPKPPDPEAVKRAKILDLFSKPKGER